MKLIRSIVRPSKFDEVKAALCSVNVIAFTFAEVRDHAPENAHAHVWRGHEYTMNDLTRVEIVAVVHDDDVDDVVSLIVRTARTQHLADGHISVMPVEHRYNIHTGRREAP